MCGGQKWLNIRYTFLGAVIGTVVCSLFNVDESARQEAYQGYPRHDEGISRPRSSPHYPPQIKRKINSKGILDTIIKSISFHYK